MYEFHTGRIFLGYVESTTHYDAFFTLFTHPPSKSTFAPETDICGAVQ